MKTVNLIIFLCVLTHISVSAMNNGVNSSNIQEFANRCYEAGMNDANQATMSRAIEITENAHKIKIKANNNIITQKFYARCLQDELTAVNNSRRILTEQLNTSNNIRNVFRNRMHEQNAALETLTDQHNAALDKIDRMKNAQLYASGVAAMILLIDPIEKQYLIDTTGLSSKEIDSKMIGERLFALSALALCHPMSAAIVATSAGIIKASQYLQN